MIDKDDNNYKQKEITIEFKCFPIRNKKVDKQAKRLLKIFSQIIEKENKHL